MKGMRSIINNPITTAANLMTFFFAYPAAVPRGRKYYVVTDGRSI
jgi:hypothetical protein